MASKCSCCQWRYADYKATNEDGTRYCEECKGGHITSAKYPGRTLYYGPQLRRPYNPSPQSRPRLYGWYSQAPTSYIKCWCCEYNYEKSAVIQLHYQCRKHSIIVCLRCAEQHQTCPEDPSAVISPTSEENFSRKLEDRSINIDPYE